MSRERVVGLLQDLIKIDSQNPPGSEKAIALFVKKYLDKLGGFKTKIYEFAKNRSNVVGILRNKDMPYTLLLSPHLDTVPSGAGWKFNPLSAHIYKGRLYGRGASDCKCNIAVALEAVRNIVENKIRLGYNLMFAATADEETGSSLGIISLLDKGIIKPNSAIILDSDDFDIITTQKGLMHFKVKIFGKKAHGAYPERGINAIEIASRVINALKEHSFKFKRNPYLNKPTINIGTIKGGDKVNIVADACEFEVDLRFLPGMSSKELLLKVKGLIGKFSRRFKIEIASIQQPYSINKDSPLVKSLRESYKEFNINSKVKGSEGATVLTFFKEHNIPAVATGFGSRFSAHATNEYVSIQNLHLGVSALQGFLEKFKFNPEGIGRPHSINPKRIVLPNTI